MKHTRRRKLTVEDFNRALRWSNVEVQGLRIPYRVGGGGGSRYRTRYRTRYRLCVCVGGMSCSRRPCAVTAPRTRCLSVPSRRASCTSRRTARSTWWSWPWPPTSPRAAPRRLCEVRTHPGAPPAPVPSLAKLRPPPEHSEPAPCSLAVHVSYLDGKGNLEPQGAGKEVGGSSWAPHGTRRGKKPPPTL